MPEYLGGGELPWLSEYSIELSRPFRALKLWLLLQQAGVAGYERLIRRNIELNDYLQKQIRARSEFRIRASGPLSITCFLYDDGASEDTERTNRRILEAVQQTGNVFLTGTRLDGEFVLRSCIVNFRTTESDVIALLDEIASVGGRSRGQAPPNGGTSG